MLYVVGGAGIGGACALGTAEADDDTEPAATAAIAPLLLAPAPANESSALLARFGGGRPPKYLNKRRAKRG